MKKKLFSVRKSNNLYTQMKGNILLRSGVFHCIVHESLSPQVRKAKVFAHGQKCSSNIHQSFVNGKQTGMEKLT